MQIILSIYRVLYIIGIIITPSPCNLCGSFHVARLFCLCTFLPGFPPCSNPRKKKKPTHTTTKEEELILCYVNCCISK